MQAPNTHIQIHINANFILDKQNYKINVWEYVDWFTCYGGEKQEGKSNILYMSFKASLGPVK